MRLLWRLIDDHLCIFANGAGDLTLLLPPILQIGKASQNPSQINSTVLTSAFEMMDDYNASHGVNDRSRVEYVSEELLAAIGTVGTTAEPMGHDYVYDTRRMIDLAGGDLKSKRQERGRFIRDHTFEAVPFNQIEHLSDCLELLQRWKGHHEETHCTEDNLHKQKRLKESLATELALRHATDLGLTGMVVFVAGQLSGFTFGELLGSDQASIVIEKTDPSIKGLPQFIFSEFCKVNWSDRMRINAGDDWGLENLAWTKNSYRPIELMQKFVVRKQMVAQVVSGFQSNAASAEATKKAIVVRSAGETDLAAAERLEVECFDRYRLTRRQLRAFHRSDSAVFFVAESEGAVVGECVALLRRQKNGTSARLYSLAVTQSARGQGVGQRLMESILAELTARGARRVHLQVESANSSAIRLYQRHDFYPVKTLPDYYGESRNGTHMVCDLNRHSIDQPIILTPAA